MEFEESILSNPEKKKFINNFIPKLYQKLTDPEFSDIPFSLKLEDPYYFNFASSDKGKKVQIIEDSMVPVK